MVDFMDPHKIIVRSAFSTFSNTRNKGESQGGQKVKD
jgi:hypothetical protein